MSEVIQAWRKGSKSKERWKEFLKVKNNAGVEETDFCPNMEVQISFEDKELFLLELLINGPSHASFSFICGLSQQEHYFVTNSMKKNPSSK